MWALDRWPRRRTSRTRHPLLTLGSIALLGFVAATVMSPTALAGPPPRGTVGPLLQLAPTAGRAAASFTAKYWFVMSSGAKCPLTTVEFSWDGKLVATAKVDPSDPKDPSYCSVTHVFGGAPTATLGSHDVSAIACFIDGNRVKQCPASTQARKPYLVTPTPTIVLVPASGPATAPFKATYWTGSPTCNVTEAQFFWDDAPIGSPVAIDPKLCTAVLSLGAAPLPNGGGTHRVSGEACNRSGCFPATRVTALYTVTVPKATGPTPTPPTTATPTPAASPSASASPSVAPSGSPSPSPTPSIAPSVSSSPTPSAGQASAPPPGPTPSDGASGGTSTTSEPPTGSGDYVPAMAAYLGGPDEGSIDPAVVATNLLLTILILFLLALTAEIFNSTMDANRDEIHGWWLRLMRGPLGVLGSMTVPGTSLTRLAGTGRVGSIARVLGVLCLLGLVYSFLSPDFGLNSQTLVLFVSLVVGLGFLTFFSEGSSTRLAARRYRANASIKLYGTAVLVSIVAVVISRLVDFQPGLVYGFIASAVIVAPVALDRRDDATLVLVPTFGLLVVSVLAWLLLGPVRAAAAGGALAPGLVETILAMIVIGGLETLFVTMIPLRFLDGATVMGWSRLAWALTFGTVTFLWWQLLLNQDHAYVEAMEQTNVQVVLATLAVFVLTTGGLWSYFRFRPSPAKAEA